MVALLSWWWWGLALLLERDKASLLLYLRQFSERSILVCSIFEGIPFASHSPLINHPFCVFHFFFRWNTPTLASTKMVRVQIAVMGTSPKWTRREASTRSLLLLRSHPGIASYITKMFHSAFLSAQESTFIWLELIQVILLNIDTNASWLLRQTHIAKAI